MRNTTFFPAVMLTLAVLASGCFDGNGNENVGSMYEPGPYEVLTDEDIVFANGLAHTQSSVTPAAVPLLLDVYSPDSDSMNRPVMMFIHGGGFTGGTKQKPEIVEMAQVWSTFGGQTLSWIYLTQCMVLIAMTATILNFSWHTVPTTETLQLHTQRPLSCRASLIHWEYIIS